jgi:hypothetical protein
MRKKSFEEDILEHTIAQSGVITQAVGLVKYDNQNEVYFI